MAGSTRNDANGNGNGNDDCAPPQIGCDSQIALGIVRTGVIKQSSKHIDICYHDIRDPHERGVVKYEYVNTNDNPTDILTKALARDTHEKFAKAMGVW